MLLWITVKMEILPQHPLNEHIYPLKQTHWYGRLRVIPAFANHYCSPYCYCGRQCVGGWSWWHLAALPIFLFSHSVLSRVPQHVFSALAVTYIIWDMSKNINTSTGCSATHSVGWRPPEAKTGEQRDYCWHLSGRDVRSLGNNTEGMAECGIMLFCSVLLLEVNGMWCADTFPQASFQH